MVDVTRNLALYKTTIHSNSCCAASDSIMISQEALHDVKPTTLSQPEKCLTGRIKIFDEGRKVSWCWSKLVVLGL